MTDDTLGASEDTKRKMREALERKQAHAGPDVSDHSRHGKVDGAQRSETGPQMFRRKSG
ncbi:DUF5302 domain-containing protein [Enemella sp. A6]|uniref:DUF5302 domain-containing protein n=1 Tax=Enemella sp. A6 TaxID=3440152 RepID=UPI003EB7EED7